MVPATQFLLLTAGLCWVWGSDAFVVPLSPASLPSANPALSLDGISLPRVGDGKAVDIGSALASSTGKTVLVLGTHPADFNMVEYCQRMRVFWPQLQEKGVTRCMMIVNGEASSCELLAELLDLPNSFEFYSDPTGQAGRLFGCSPGWGADLDVHPQLKLFMMGIGVGPPWMTLPAVLTGYFGNPNGRREWIEESLKQGQLKGRWPAVLDLSDDGAIVGNKFDTFPLLASWGRRPFELATLRLQNLLGIQLKNWNELKPVEGDCLTQLGGLTVVNSGGEPIYSWLDAGLCDVPDFYDLVDSI